MQVSVTALIENSVQGQTLACEFGLSLLVRAGARTVLFDTGASGAFLDNAAVLGIDLSALDAAVLSHGHVDHCRGLVRMLEEGRLNAPLYLHRSFFTDRYWDKTTLPGCGYLKPTSSGLDAAYLMRQRTAWRPVGQTVFPLFPEVGLYLLGNTPRACRFEPMDPNDLVFDGGGFRTDDYRDELALVVEGEECLTLVTGCAHAGLVNLCTHAQAVFGKPVGTYIGGTHLAPSPLDRAMQTAEYVNASSIRTLAPCHCTGAEALALFRARCPAFVPFATGDTITTTE